MTVKEIIEVQVKLEEASEAARREAYAAASKLKEAISSIDEDEDCESLIDTLDDTTKAIEKLVLIRKEVSDWLDIEYKKVD